MLVCYRPLARPQRQRSEMGRGRPRRKGKDKYGVDYKIFGTCSRHARAAGSDTAEQAASLLVQWFGCPMIYAEPPKPRWWTEKLRECRRNFGSFLLLIAAAALAIPCVFIGELFTRAGRWESTPYPQEHEPPGPQTARRTAGARAPAQSEPGYHRNSQTGGGGPRRQPRTEDIIKATLGANAATTLTTTTLIRPA